MPARAGTNVALQKLSGVSYQTSEQHNDISASKQTWYVNNTLKIIDHMSERNPLSESDALDNIGTGLTDQPGVNVDKTWGEDSAMEGKSTHV